MATARASAGRPHGPKKILLVDDSSLVLLMAGTLLTKNRFVVVTAHDGVEGVAKALEERPDLILMDVVMPRMDGFAAVRQLRADDRTRDIPIVMLTTRGELESLENGYQSGCTDYVTKPFDGLELVSKVRSCLGV